MTNMESKAMWDRICRVLTEYELKDDPVYNDITIDDHADQLYEALCEVAVAIGNADIVFREDGD